MSSSAERQDAAGPPDWGAVRYECIAPDLLPAAQAVVDAAAPAPGEHVVDVGCGTGNAALLAAARGARVTGVDPAGRLLDVAREQAKAQALDVAFVPGEAAAMPLPDGSADALLSVFGVIFAPDAPAAAAEMARVTVPDGRIVLSAWLPEGAIMQAMRIAGEAVAQVAGDPVSRVAGRSPGPAPGPPPFAWHDRGALAELLAPHGFAVTAQPHSLAFTAPSARELFDRQSRHNPVLAMLRSALERSADGPAVFGRMLETLEAGNEDPAAFRVTSRYVVMAGTRQR